jgi:hypothetical protein
MSSMGLGFLPIGARTSVPVHRSAESPIPRNTVPWPRRAIRSLSVPPDLAACVGCAQCAGLLASARDLQTETPTALRHTVIVVVRARRRRQPGYQVDAPVPIDRARSGGREWRRPSIVIGERSSTAESPTRVRHRRTACWPSECQ